MRRTAEFKLKNASILDNLMPVDEEKSFLENNVVNVLVDRDQKGRRILITYNGGKYISFPLDNIACYLLFYGIQVSSSNRRGRGDWFDD
jgi:hypothetical protein